MASGTIPMVNAAGVYSRSIDSDASSTVHVKYDSTNKDAVFTVAYCRHQVNYLPGTVVIFKKSGDLAPSYVDTHGTGTYVTQVSSVAKESTGFYITFNVGYIIGVVSSDVPFTLSY